ncbi:hypothetical protein GIB67_006634 [Kingdonia uniflora]|uniref:Uncharacterized protein n=1 Tax=Kingdonia uniflora TaxID=39325 RepID=A0A7J7LEF5_9MAGN|nr:hypothetical protein GIB67_006634 [Kingdonia uniflora]
MTSDRFSEKALKIFREALDNYKLENVIWDSYLEKRADRHIFKKVASFTGFICSPEHIEAYYPDRVQRELNRRGKKVHDGIPACVEGYFEWFKRVSFTKLCPTTVNLDENNDGRILGDGGVVGGGVGSPVGGGSGGGLSQSENVEGQNEDISCLEVEISNLKSVKEIEDQAKSELLEAIKLKNLECNSLKEINKKLSEDVCSLKKLLADLNIQLEKKVDECETLASINEKLMKEVVNLQPQCFTTLDVAYNNLGERRYETLLRAFNFSGVFVEYLYMGHLLATYYEKVVIFISNNEALTFLPMFWPKANNKISKLERFENILTDNSKYWWVGIISNENFVKSKAKYLSPIPLISILCWAHVPLEIPNDLMKASMKTYFDAPNQSWMKLMKDNNVNPRDYSTNDLFS